jgi:plastocyanin
LFFIFRTTTGSCTIHVVNSAGTSFSPDSIAANLDDTVNFVLSTSHSAVEVSQATWNLNGNTSNGGFLLPLTGGMVKLTQVKTYYFVCGIHYFMGMKGRIFVSNSTGIKTTAVALQGLEVFPNPATAWITIKANLQAGKENQIKIFNILGNCLYQKENIPSIAYINIAGIPSGVYFIEVRSEDLLMQKKLIITR